MATIDYLNLLPESILNNDPNSNVGKLWSLFATQLDLLLVEVAKVYLLDVVSSQSGANLDQIGKVINQDRLGGESDTDYRISIFTAIKSKISSGSVSDILDVIETIKAGDTTKLAYIIELFPASIQVSTNMTELTADNNKILNETRAAGIKLFLSFFTGTPFVFFGDADGLGFGGLESFNLALDTLDTGDLLSLDTGDLFALTVNESSEQGGSFSGIVETT